ncbi:MAG TPA: NAD-dependent epimerase/dehydratase family protein [Polyangiaceae bacterium]|nr:NAD-dependent epimerase/dehydratase family protein [Polyangiaceae bacterium]
MRVLVTGGAGFIGSHVVQGALAAGHHVAVLDNFSTGKVANVPAGVRVFEADLRDRDATFRAIGDFKPELVSHLAAQASVPVSMKDPRFDAEVNIVGGLNLLDACTAASAGVRRFVFASTGGAIYGEVPEGQQASEAFACEPKSPYGISKLTFERLLTIYREQRGLATTVLRYSNVYGPRQDPHGEAGVVAVFLDSALSHKPLNVFAKATSGDGGCIRDYVFVGDAARANLRALAGELPHAVMNVGSGRATTTLKLAHQIVALAESRSGIEQAGARAGDIERSLLDVSRFEQALGAPTPLSTGLAETVRWYRAR